MSGKPRARNSGLNSGHMMRDSALGLVPETLDHYISLGKAIWEAGPLGPAELEIARLRNANKVNCVYCRNVRYDIAIEDGLTESRVKEVEGDFDTGELGTREKLIIAFTDQFLMSPGDMDSELRSALNKNFTAPELAHLSYALVYFSGFSRCAVALGGMPDELPRMEISVPE
jgi:alkylhydroperoxidase family enzyme